MNLKPPAGVKRAVNLTLSEAVVVQAREHTANLSATVELLLQDFVTRQDTGLAARRRAAETAAEGWNAFNSQHGSFADEHSTL